MVKSFLAKKRSKRLTCRKKFKIEKKIREHNRKSKKEGKLKASKKKTFNKKKPDIHVPNKCPFKEEILKEAQEIKRNAELARETLKKQTAEKRKSEKSKTLDEKRKLESVVEDAEKRQTDFDANPQKLKSTEKGRKQISSNETKSADHSLRQYFSEVKKVIEKSDVIIQVLDARDPLGSRSFDMEKSIIETGKRLILLLNKIDLIPKENVISWLKYLRNEFPTVAFKASTQEQNKNLGRAGHSIVAATSKCVGADLLMKILGNYCRNKDVKTSICVGIVGYPNVGKSSVINSLKRKASCHVGAQPGITKALQEVHLDKKIRLLDSPGVAMCSKGTFDRAEMALKNVLRVDLLDDPVTPVEAILRKCTKDNLILQYKISDFDDIDEFLSNVARKIGKLKKGGIPDRRMAAKKVLHDWNSGKIRYYTVPPEYASGIQVVSTELVQEMSKEFDIDSIETEQNILVDELSTQKQENAMLLAAWKNVVKIDQKDDVEMETDEKADDDATNWTSSNAKFAKSIRLLSSKNNDENMLDENEEAELEGNKKLNSKLQKKFKRDRKKRKKNERVATDLSTAFETVMEIDKPKEDAYDFATDFK